MITILILVLGIPALIVLLWFSILLLVATSDIPSFIQEDKNAKSNGKEVESGS